MTEQAQVICDQCPTVAHYALYNTDGELVGHRCVDCFHQIERVTEDRAAFIYWMVARQTDPTEEGPLLWFGDRMIVGQA